MTSLADRVIRGSFFRILNPVLNIIVTFFIMPFVIRSIGDRLYGLWVLAGAMVGYYGFLDLGLSTANERFISRALGKGNQAEVNEVFNTCLFLFLAAGLLALIASIIIAIIAPQFVKDPTDIYILRIIISLIGITMAFSFPARAFAGFLRAHVRFDVLNIIEIAKLFLRTALILYFLGRGFGIIALAIISLGMEISQMTIIVIYVIKRYTDIKVSFSHFIKNKIRPLLNYSIYSFISNVANQLQFHLDAFVITAFIGLVYVTHYNIGARITRYYITLIYAAIALMLPVFSRFEGQDNYEQIREKFILVVKLNTIFSVFLGGSLLIFGKAFIITWMGVNYIDSYHVLVILTIGLIFNTIQISSRTLLYSLSKHKMYAITSTGEGIANLVLSLILVRKLGILGVAIGTTIPTLVTNLFIIPIYTNRVINLQLSRYIKAVLGVFTLGAAVHLIIWLIIKDLILCDYLRMFILGILTSIVFFSINGFILLNKNERRYFKIPI